MVRFVVLINFTEKGVAAIKESPARAEAFSAAAAKAGACVESLFWTMGPYDGVVILSAPDEATAAAVILQLGKTHAVRSCMLRALDAGEFRKILGKIS